MEKVIATVYGPDVEMATALPFQRKLRELLEEVGLTTEEVFWRLDIAQLREAFRVEPTATLAVGWSMTESPAWGDLFRTGLSEIPFRQFLGLDLFERVSANGQEFKRPRFGAGLFWGRKIQRSLWDHFLNGCIVQTKTLYGLRRVEDRRKRHGKNRFSLNIEPGEPHEVAIVRFIFDQFVNQQLNRTQICNLLNAQGITPPGRSRAWNHQNVGTILSNELYTGASRLKDCVKYDVFPPLIDRSTYFMAQARLHKDQRNFCPEDRFAVRDE